MSQSTPYAVMATRKSDVEGELDLFPTPPWATRALCEIIKPAKDMHAWEPACGLGHMSRALREYFCSVSSSDVFDYGYGVVRDFLSGTNMCFPWIITNPPFVLAEEFALTAIKFSSIGCAMLVRTTFLEGCGRFARLFSTNPPTEVWQFVERVPMHKGRLLRKGSTATAYAWMIWKHGEPRRPLEWIAPCRKRLERDEDYED